jgi:hypothetical protein
MTKRRAARGWQRHLPFIVIGVILLAIGVGAWWTTRPNADIPSEAVVQSMTEAFVTELRAQNWEDAYAMTVPDFQERNPLDTFITVTQRDMGFALAGYQSLEICITREGDQANRPTTQAQGIFTYSDESGPKEILFNSVVTRYENEWRIAGFQIDADAITRPLGECL